MWRVRVLVGDEEIAIHRLHEGADVVVGRDPGVDLQIPERSVSRRHCLLKAHREGVEVLDLGSANGVYVGKRRVRQVILRAGEELRMGLVRLQMTEDLGQTGMIPLAQLGLGPPSDVPSEPTDLNRSVVGQRAYRSLERDRLAVLVEAGKSLSLVVDLDSLIERILDHLFQILDVRRAVLALLEPDGRLVARHVRPSTEIAELSDLCSRTIIQNVLKAGEPRIIDDAAADPASSAAESVRFSDIRAAICAPLVSPTRTLGALYADYPGRARIYTKNDLDFVGAFASLCGIAIENAQIHQELRLRDRLQRDLEIAAEIQKSLLPDLTFRHAALELDWAYLPSRQVGGDFYDNFPLDGDRVALVIGDVSGKSIGAALSMAQLTACIRTLVPHDPTPIGVLAGANQLLSTRGSAGTFASAFYTILSPDSAQLSYASAGHNPGLLLVPGAAEVRELEPTGMLLGVVHSATYEERVLAFPPGSLLLLYTDGVVESRDRFGGFFGIDRVKQILVQHRLATCRDILRELRAALSAHAHESKALQDDVAMVVVRPGVPTL